MADTTEISIPFQEAESLSLRIATGPCRIRVRPGDSEHWVSGRYEDPTGLLPLRTTQTGGQVTLSQTTSVSSPGKLTRAPSLEIGLGTAKPYELTLEGGANETVLDLGGLPVSRLALRQGAGKSEVDFSAPNPGEMRSLEVASGGVALQLRNLANANFAELSLSGGAAAYKLEFGGQLRRDASVKLTTGVSSIELDVPAANPARIKAESVLGGLDVGDGFVTREGAFLNQAAASGGQPLLGITVTAVFGALRIRST